jgi:hypothetical protein
VWTGSPEKQLGLLRQCSHALCLKDKSIFSQPKKREQQFPDISEYPNFEESFDPSLRNNLLRGGGSLPKN